MKFWLLCGAHTEVDSINLTAQGSSCLNGVIKEQVFRHIDGKLPHFFKFSCFACPRKLLNLLFANQIFFLWFFRKNRGKTESYLIPLCCSWPINSSMTWVKCYVTTQNAYIFSTYKGEHFLNKATSSRPPKDISAYTDLCLLFYLLGVSDFLGPFFPSLAKKIKTHPYSSWVIFSLPKTKINFSLVLSFLSSFSAQFFSWAWRLGSINPWEKEKAAYLTRTRRPSFASKKGRKWTKKHSHFSSLQRVRVSYLAKVRKNKTPSATPAMKTAS